MFLSLPSFSYPSDTLKMSIAGILPFNKIYIYQDGKMKRIYKGTHIKNFDLCFKNEEDESKLRLYYKFGLFSIKKPIIIPPQKNKYLLIYFGLESFYKGSVYVVWADNEILYID